MKNLLMFFLLSTICSYGQCGSDISKSGNLNTQVQESSTWIKTSTTTATTAVSNQNVRFDANPTNGYVELNPGFTSSPTGTGVFIAQALDGCGGSTPRKIVSETIDYETNYSDAVVIYPNPTKNLLHVEMLSTNEVEVQVLSLTGKKLLAKTFKEGEDILVDIENLPVSSYLVRIISDGIDTVKKVLRID